MTEELQRRLDATLEQIAETEALLQRLQPETVLRQIADTQALLQQLQAQRSVLEAELRGRRRRGRRSRKP